MSQTIALLVAAMLMTIAAPAASALGTPTLETQDDDALLYIACELLEGDTCKDFYDAATAACLKLPPLLAAVCVLVM